MPGVFGLSDRRYRGWTWRVCLDDGIQKEASWLPNRSYDKPESLDESIASEPRGHHISLTFYVESGYRAFPYRK